MSIDWKTWPASSIVTAFDAAKKWCRQIVMLEVELIVSKSWYKHLAAFLARAKTIILTAFAALIAWCRRPTAAMTAFALWNIAMYLLIRKFWTGGDGFLPMIGQMGPENTFLFAFVVNAGVIAGAFLSAQAGAKFGIRKPDRDLLRRMILGGVLIGAGITLAPGTGTAALTTGIPMLSVSSIVSAAGIVVGALIMFNLDRREKAS